MARELYRLHRPLIGVLQVGGELRLDGGAGRAVLPISLAAHTSAREGREVRPDEVP